MKIVQYGCDPQRQPVLCDAVTHARLRRDIGRNSTLGLVATTREDGADHSRLLGGDARFYHSRLYFVEVQAVQSWNCGGGAATSGPLFQAMWDRTGRAWGFNYSVRAVAPGFQAAAGFVPRTDVIDANFFNRFTGYGSPGSRVQTYGAFLAFSRLFEYARPSRGAIEGSEGLNPTATLRGGWSAGGSLTRAFVSYHDADYAGYQVQVPLGLPPGTAPFVVPGPERDLWGGSLRINTPTWRLLTLNASATWGAVAIFKEAARGTNLLLSGTVDLRPAPALRLSFQTTRRTIDRSRREGDAIDRLQSC